MSSLKFGLTAISNSDERLQLARSGTWTLHATLAILTIQMSRTNRLQTMLLERRDENRGR